MVIQATEGLKSQGYGKGVAPMMRSWRAVGIIALDAAEGSRPHSPRPPRGHGKGESVVGGYMLGGTDVRGGGGGARVVVTAGVVLS
jgi:hypothetical protein